MSGNDYNFPELDNHMLIERERMLMDADEIEEMNKILAEEEARLDAQVEEHFAKIEKGILSEEEAEELINNYIRQDWSGSRMDQIPW